HLAKSLAAAAPPDEGNFRSSDWCWSDARRENGRRHFSTANPCIFNRWLCGVAIYTTAYLGRYIRLTLQRDGMPRLSGLRDQGGDADPPRDLRLRKAFSLSCCETFAASVAPCGHCAPQCARVAHASRSTLRRRSARAAR